MKTLKNFEFPNFYDVLDTSLKFRFNFFKLYHIWTNGAFNFIYYMDWRSFGNKYIIKEKRKRI